MAELRHVKEMGEALIATHLDSTQWSFGFDRAKRRAGLCNYSERKISVSRYFAAQHDSDEIKQVILHEIAHALAGHRAGHGAVWKQTAAGIGYRGGRTTAASVAPEHAPWVGACAAGHTHYRFRSPTRTHSCGLCSKRFSSEHVITWRRRSR